MAQRICDHCFTCRYLAKRCKEQLMAALPSHRMGPALLIDSTVVDLFEPINFVDPNNKSRTGTGWGVVFVSPGTCGDDAVLFYRLLPDGP